MLSSCRRRPGQQVVIDKVSASPTELISPPRPVMLAKHVAKSAAKAAALQPGRGFQVVRLREFMQGAPATLKDIAKAGELTVAAV